MKMAGVMNQSCSKEHLSLTRFQDAEKIAVTKENKMKISANIIVTF